jgi:hypothetical protein
MADFTLTPNMSLPLPTVRVDPGPDYAENQNAAIQILDSHDHSNGSGVKITPDGININAGLNFKDQVAANLYYAHFTTQLSALTGTNFAYNVNGDLYFNDGAGNQIAITSGGGVAGSPGSIGSLVAPASATYSSGSKTFTWLADSSKSAAMDNGAVTIRETNVASSKGITLAAPAGLAADYQITLPPSGAAGYLTSNGSGVLSVSSANQIAAAVTRATGTTVGAGGVAISNTSGVFSTTATSPAAVTNLSVTITTSGRPVCLELQADGVGSSYFYIFGGNAATGGSNNCVGNIVFYQGVTAIGISTMGRANVPVGDDVAEYYPASISFIDAVGAGTYTYSVSAYISFLGTFTGKTFVVSGMKLVAYEL